MKLIVSDNKANLIYCVPKIMGACCHLLVVGLNFPLEHEAGTWDRNGLTKMPKNTPFREGR